MDPRITTFRAALDARPLSGFQVRLVAMAIALLIMDGYDTQAIGYVAPILSGQWHVDRGAFGPIFSAGLVGLTLGALVFAPVSDRVGCRAVLIGCTALYAVLTLVTAISGSWTMLLVLRFVTGLGLGGAMPSAIALVSDYAPSRLRNLMVSLTVAGFAIGGALGGVAAATLIARFGWQIVFVLGGVVPLLALPVLVRWLPESLPRLLADPVAGRRLASVAAQVAPEWDVAASIALPAPPRDTAFPVSQLFRHGFAIPTVLIWAVFFWNLLLLFFFSNWIPTIVSAAGYRIETASLMGTLFQLSGIAGSLLMAPVADRSGRPQLVLACAFAGAALCCWGIGAASGSFPALLASVAVAGFCIVGGQGMGNAFAGNYYPAAIRATGIGWALGIGRVGSILGPLLGGLLIGSGADLQTLFGFFAVPALLAAVCAIAVRGTPDVASVHPEGRVPAIGRQGRIAPR